MPGLRSALFAANTTQVNNRVVTLPTGATTGDLVVIVAGQRNTGAVTLSATAGWTVLSAGEQTGDPSGAAYGAWWRVLEPGDTSPTVTASDTGRWAWGAIAIQPTSAGVLSLDGTHAVTVDTTGAATSQPPAKTATVADVVSVLIQQMTAAVNGATAVNTTPPTDWTEPASGDGSTASGTTTAARQIAASCAYRTGQSGTITPGTLSTNVNAIGVMWHVLVQEATTGQTVAVNQVTSTETAQPVAHRKTRTVGQPTESDTALRLAKRAPVAQHAEADTAQPVAAISTRSVGQPVEGDTAQPIGSAKTKAVGQLVETDTAQPAARVKSAALGQATEADTAQKLATGALGVASEQDTANPMRPVKTRAIGQALTVETAQLLTHGKRRAVAQIVSLDTATGIARLKSRAVGQATSTETVTALTSLKARAVAQATETDTARFVTGPADGDDGGFRLPLLTTALPDLAVVTHLDLTTRTDLETLGVTTELPDLATATALDIPALVTALPNLATATTLPALDTTTALEGKVNDLFSDVFEEVY